MPNTRSSPNEDPAAASNATPHVQLSAMIDAGRAFSGHERNCCFLNMRNGIFADLSAGSGLDFPDDGRAVAVTDWDQDGDLDLWISNRNAPRLRLMRNDAATVNHFLALRLVGDGRATNRDAIGARVEVKLLGDDSNAKLVRTLRAGEGFLSQSSKWLHIGLGEHTEIEQVIVRWPGGKTEPFSGVEADRRYRLVQGTAKAEPLSPRHDVIKLSPSVAPVSTSAGAIRVPAVTLLRAPKLNVTRIDGSPAAIGEDRSLLINFWATWCAPCLVELGEIRDRADELRAAHVDVLALSVNEISATHQSSDDPRQVMAKLGFPFPHTSATEPLVAAFQEFHNNLVGLNRPLPLPSSFLVDPQGHLSVVYKGGISVDQVLSDVGHSAGTLDERLRSSAQVNGSMIMHPIVRRSVRNHEASLHLRYGLARLANKDLDGAQYHFSAALNLNANSAAAAKQLARVYLEKREWTRAADQLDIALGLNPGDPGGHYTLAQLRSRLNQPEKARTHYSESLRLRPNHALAHFGLAALLADQGEAAAAVSHYKEGLKIQPDSRFAANNLAWLLATHRHDEVRDPAEALRIARDLNAASGNQIPNILDTLSAAQAASGDFVGATKTARRAIEISQAAGNNRFATEMTDRLTLYQAGKPFLEMPVRADK